MLHRIATVTLAAALASPALTIVPGVRDGITNADVTGALLTVTYLAPNPGGGFVAVTVSHTLGSPQAFAAIQGGSVLDFGSLILSTMTQVVLDGTGAGLFFDRTSPNPGSPGSGPGLDLEFIGLAPGTPATVTYSNPVAIGAAAPVGDLFSVLTIDFPNGAALVTFRVDADAAIPEPATGLMLVGALGAAWLLRRASN